MSDLCMCRVQASSSAAEAVQMQHPEYCRVVRPEVERTNGRAQGKTKEAARAALFAQNNICTCARGVPSFLCRVRACWALEVGTCEPIIKHINVQRPELGFFARECECIRWDLMTEDGRLSDRNNTDDGYEFVTRFEIISGERDQVRRKVYYRGDSQVAWRSRLWPPPRVQRCDSCLSHFGTYVPTCDRKDNEPCTRKGRLIMVLNNDLNLAVACTIRCAGHSGGPRRLQRHNFCGVENLPDLFVYR